MTVQRFRLPNGKEMYSPFLGDEASRLPKPVLALDNNVIRGAGKEKKPGNVWLGDFRGKAILAVPGDVVFEITTGIESEKEFNFQRAAAKKVFDSNTTFIMLPDSGFYFRWLLGLISDEDLIQRTGMLSANLYVMASLADFAAWKMDKGLQKWNMTREKLYSGWAEDHKKYLQDHYKNDGQKAIEDYARSEKIDEILNDIIERYCAPGSISAERRALTKMTLGHFLEIVRIYQLKAFTNGGDVDKNDRGDIDIISFATDSSPLVGGKQLIVITNEEGWPSLSKEARGPRTPLVVSIGNILNSI